METIEIKYGNVREQNPIIPLLEEPSFELIDDWGDDSPIVLNGVKTVLGDVKQYFIYDVLGFCGCGTPFETQVFWLAQIKAIVSGAQIDYTGFPGGIEFFIDRAIQQKVITEDKQLTPLGKLIVLFIENDNKLTLPDDDDEAEQYNPETPPIEETEQTSAMNINQRIRWFMLKYMTYIALRKWMEKPGSSSYETYQEKLGVLNKIIPDPVYYWVAYQLGDLAWEEHGGTAPGWLTNDGFEIYWKLVDEFGVGEIEIFDLLEKGYQFKNDDLLKEELQKRRTAFIAVQPGLDWDTIIPLPSIDIRTGIQQSFKGE